MKFKRAILSVSDKTGIVELARFLEKQGTEILSTGGTAKHLAENGVAVTSIAGWSGAPEVFGGRVKTLTPKVFGGLLFDRANASHVAEAKQHGIEPIDLVVVNLYPFEATIEREGVTIREAIEQIDIGGPSMLRASAKNFRHVVVLCDPAMYAGFIGEAEGGDISEAFRLRCAIAVFRKTAEYDATISGWLGSQTESNTDAGLPAHIALNLRRVQTLRYGENPQQSAAFYANSSSAPYEQIHGKELSYNNLLDLDAAASLAYAFEAPATAIIKHTNPCGVGIDPQPARATRIAIDADPVSAYGGIAGLNRMVDAATAEVLATLFLEVVVAPKFDSEAIEILARKKNLRLIVLKPKALPFVARSAVGGYLLQSPDTFNDASTWKCVTKRQPSDAERSALRFAWIVCAHVKSNAILITTGTQSVGVGAGQMSRVDSAKLAVMKAAIPVAGCVAASDAFFPFRDGLDILGNAGITAIVQPGGSVRDAEVIAAADEHDMAMMFTGERHFRH